MMGGIIEPDGLAYERGISIGEAVAPSSFPTFVLRSLSQKHGVQAGAAGNRDCTRSQAAWRSVYSGVAAKR